MALATRITSWLEARFPNWCRNNTIARFDEGYSTRRRKTNRYWRWIAAALRYLGLMFGLILAGGVFTWSLLQRDAYPIYETFGSYTGWYVAAVIVAHFVLQFQTLARSAESLSRERQGLRWDYLRLTGITSKALIRGKWWAVVKRQFYSYLWLGVLSSCAVIWLGYSNSVRILAFYISRSSLPDLIEAITLPHPIALLYLFAFISLLTLLNLGFTAACGLLGASLGRHGDGGFIRAIGLRIELALFPLVLSCLSGVLIPTLFAGSSIAQFLWNPFYVLLGSAVPIIDNGLIFGGALSSVQYQFEPVTTSPVLDDILQILSLLFSPFMFVIWLRYTLGRATGRVEKLGIVKERWEA